MLIAKDDRPLTPRPPAASVAAVPPMCCQLGLQLPRRGSWGQGRPTAWQPDPRGKSQHLFSWFAYWNRWCFTSRFVSQVVLINDYNDGDDGDDGWLMIWVWTKNPTIIAKLLETTESWLNIHKGAFTNVGFWHVGQRTPQGTPRTQCWDAFSPMLSEIGFWLIWVIRQYSDKRCI